VPSSVALSATPDNRTLVLVCHGPSCSERGGTVSCQRLREALASSPARRSMRVVETGCLDNCATGPNVLLSHESQIRTGVLPAEVEALVDLLAGGTTATPRP
jgi:NADH:ubiquinone oxidoreductase subunit E